MLANDSHQNKQVVRRIFEDMVNSANTQLLNELIAEDYEGTQAGAPATGRTAFAATMENLRHAFPDIHYSIDDLLAEGDRVSVRWRWSGTHRGVFRTPLGEYPPTGKHVANDGIAVFQLKEGRAWRSWLITDRLGFLQRLGGTPASADREPATRHAQPPSSSATMQTGVSTGRVGGPNERPAELDQLNSFIGRWMTEGETVGERESPATTIVASDVYEWAPGRYFVMHSAYGRIGTIGVGGVEMIGFDPATSQFQCMFFDSQGNTSRQTLSSQDGIWRWNGPHARCTGVLSDDGRTLTARHERSDDGAIWVPSMNVVLRKID